VLFAVVWAGIAGGFLMEKCVECMLTRVGTYDLAMVLADGLSCLGVDEVIRLFRIFRVRNY